MNPSAHRFILPPLLLGAHLLLLLPLFLAPPQESLGHGPDLLPQDDDQEQSLLRRVHLRHSVPLGILGFAGVHVLKQLAGKVPLPKHPRRIQLAARIEKVVLFGLGVVEEIWRWGLVRLLIRIEGGKGGFRGRGELWDLAHAPWIWIGPAPGYAAGILSPANTKFPSIWEAVYVMGWTWSLVETVLSWYTVRPTSPHEMRHFQEPRGVHVPVQDNSPRRPLLGKWSRRNDYGTIHTSDDNSGGPSRASERHSSFFDSILYKRRNLGSLRSQDRVSKRRRGCREGDVAILGPISTSPHIGGSSSTTACDDSLQDSATTPKPYGKAVDVENGEATPRASRAIRVPPLEPQDGISDNDYGDDEGSLSGFGSDSGLSSRSSCSGRRIAPLLSSSLPYEPEQQHPHHMQVLLRQTSYSTLGDAAAAVLSSSVAGDSGDDDGEGDEIVVVHEDDDQTVESSETDPIHEISPLTPSINRSPRRRIYPSFPSYSSSYNHTHFPQSSGAAPAPSPTTTTATIRHHYYHTRRRVYGVSVDRLHAYLPVMWRTAGAFRHIGHAMFFAWAPALVFDGRFQWWCFLVLVMLAFRKGWNTVEWFGGSASRAGLLRSSALLFGIDAAIYLVSLSIWGVLG